MEHMMMQCRHTGN